MCTPWPQPGLVILDKEPSQYNHFVFSIAVLDQCLSKSTFRGNAWESHLLPERTEKPIAHTTEMDGPFKRSDFPAKRTISRTSLFSIKVLVIWRVFFMGGSTKGYVIKAGT